MDNLTNTGLGGSPTSIGGFGGQTDASGMGSGSTRGFGNAADDLASSAQELKGQAQQKVHDLQGQAVQLKDQAIDKARTAVEEQKSKAANTIDDLAQSARDAVGELRQNPTIAPIARYGDQAADALERFATTLRNKDIDSLVTEVSGLVRRNPAIAIGVAVAAGFALTRLLRGSSGSDTGGFTGGSRFSAMSDDDYAPASGFSSGPADSSSLPSSVGTRASSYGDGPGTGFNS